jgi:Tfp pilus assembly protein PilN
VTAPTSNRPIAINLLSQDEFSQSAVGRVMLWALSIGRYVVVFTELIVIMSFLSRFKLDRDLTNLNEDINRQKAIILSYGNLENDFRFAQAQLELVRSTQNQLPPTDILALLSKTTPTDVRIDQLQMTDKGMQLSATALSTQGFVRFIANLLGSEAVSHLTLNGVNSKDQGLTITFEISADLQKTL